ncbi:carbohydrate kinase [Pseudaminobacter sp. 19-2017]|uniref:Carbohydrate kinase n=1 Tax=Pseudaminobacter soli (ex Zhang et al. 2022) TaxID=2831468 RepID=A0A942DX29_9HYPH|nr:FGGY-family carbohydrate kinase [Pseudaminobacter soli]MBS3648502.1 carbohydrate kinase [Pseudaminobacter soli]
MMRYLLGVDAGSSITKAALFDFEGTELTRAAERVDLDRSRAGWCEVDPDQAWNAAKTTIRGAVRQASVRPEQIAAIGISAAMVGAWLVDAEGNALRPGINWEDSRTQHMLDRRLATDPDFYRRIFRADGCVMQQGCTLPVAAWLRENEPDVFGAAAHIFSYKDFLRMKLTGIAGADRTEAAVAPGDARRRDRSPEMLELFGLSDVAGKLPEAKDSEEIAGYLTQAAAEELGLAPGTPVAVGAGDVPSTIVGASALQPGTALVILGTTCIAGVVSDEPVFTPPDLGLLFTLPGKTWFRSMVNVAGTLNLDWVISTILGETKRDAALFEALDRAISEVLVGSEGVVYLPYLSDSGIIAPVFDQRARAGFTGLAPRHGRPHMLRAVYEGVILAVRDLMQHLPPVQGEILLTGGGANSLVWTQMLADALSKPVVVPAGLEFGARGAALLAATAIGAFPSVREASVSTRKIARRQEPNAGAREAWDRAFSAYSTQRDLASRKSV